MSRPEQDRDLTAADKQKVSASLPRRSARSVLPSRTRARASSMLTKLIRRKVGKTGAKK